MHVRVCVECGEEYRPEIATCADCGGLLEDRHGDEERTRAPAFDGEPGVAEDESALVESVLSAERASALTDSADRLMEAGIPFRLRPARGGHGYHLLVAEGDRERALKALGIAADAREGECPACGTRLTAGAAECAECGLAVGDEPEADPDSD